MTIDEKMARMEKLEALYEAVKGFLSGGVSFTEIKKAVEAVK